MPPLSFLAHPERWLWAIHQRRATLSGAPNFAYELCLAKLTDADVERLGELLQGFRGALRSDKPGQHADLHREAGKPSLEGLEVLADQNGRRCEDGDLLAVLNGLERRSDGDFRLSDTGGTQEHKGSNGLVGILKTGPVALDGLDHLGDGFVLTNDASTQFIGHF